MYFKKAILLAALAIGTAATASGIKVSPSKMALHAKTNGSATKKITISNPTSDVQIFKVYPDDFLDNISINPASFTLEAGANKNVIVAVKDAGGKKGSENLTTNISVTARPLAETQFQTNAGIKIPLTITFSENNTPNKNFEPLFYIALFIVLFTILKSIFLLRRKIA